MTIEVSGSQLAALVRGDAVMVGPSKRVITLDDGPFVVQRHHGPGPHPGTGTSQDVHGGGAGQYYRDSARDLFRHIPKTKRWDAVRDGLEAIDSVHEIDIWGALPLQETRAKNKGASYHVSNGLPNRMKIKIEDQYGENTELSIVHETGHHIDHWLLGQVEPYGVRWLSEAIAEQYGLEKKILSVMGIKDMIDRLYNYPVQNFEEPPSVDSDEETMFLYPSEEISEAGIYLWDAIVDTPSYQGLHEFRSGHHDIVPPKDYFLGDRDNPSWVAEESVFKGLPVVMDAPYDLLRVLRRPREVFTRAYVQYITHRSGNEQMTRAMNETIDFQRAGGIPTQWEPGEFEPIASAFDELFRRKGWLKE